MAVVIPTYNHGHSVAQVLKKVLPQGLPVFVVDDGSTDQTPQQLAPLAGLDGVHLLRHHQNRGKGAALLTGMRAAARIADQVITLDADGQHLPRDLPVMIEAAHRHPKTLIIGHRREMVTAPWTSRFGRGFSNFWLYLACGRALNDSQSGYRVYPLAEVLTLDVKARRYQYEVEVLARAVWAGLPIVEVMVDVDYQPFGRRISHFHPWQDFVRNSQMFSRIITRRVFTPCLWRSPRPGRKQGS